MKKTLYLIIALACLVVLSSCVGAQSRKEAGENLSSFIPSGKGDGGLTVSYSANERELSADEALAAALLHASLKREEISFLKNEPDYDDGRLVFEIEFRAGHFEYDYEIDARNGAVLSFERETVYG